MWRKLRKMLKDNEPADMPSLEEAKAAILAADAAHEQTKDIAKKKDELSDVFVSVIVQGIVAKQKGAST